MLYPHLCWWIEEYHHVLRLMSPLGSWANIPPQHVPQCRPVPGGDVGVAATRWRHESLDEMLLKVLMNYHNRYNLWLTNLKNICFPSNYSLTPPQNVRKESPFVQLPISSQQSIFAKADMVVVSVHIGLYLVTYPASSKTPCFSGTFSLTTRVCTKATAVMNSCHAISTLNCTV